MDVPTPSSRTTGGQTVARGLRILRAVVMAPRGMTVQEVAEQFDIHRSIAFRVLNTIAEENLIARGADGRFRGAIGLLDLLTGVEVTLTLTAQPIMQRLADECSATVSLFVQHGDRAAAIAVAEPANPTWRIGYAIGSRIPLDRGAVAYALRTVYPEHEDDLQQVKDARAAGYSRTFAEVEPNFFGLAAPIRQLGDRLPACLCVITNREEVVNRSVEVITRAADELGAAIAATPHTRAAADE